MSRIIYLKPELQPEKPNVWVERKGMSRHRALELHITGNGFGDDNRKIAKVTVVNLNNGTFMVNIRDLQFLDWTKAALYLQHIAMTELPENVKHMVG